MPVAERALDLLRLPRRPRLRTVEEEQRDATIFVFAYAHIPVLAALTAVGAGITLAIEHSSERAPERASAVQA